MPVCSEKPTMSRWLPDHTKIMFNQEDAVTVMTSSRVVGEDKIGPATMIILKSTGKIIVMYPAVLPRSYFTMDALSTLEYTNFSPHILMPGLVDTHVHVNEPGRTDTEGFYTATRAAISGGVTTIIDMPLNSIPATTSVTALNTKLAAAKGKCWCDVGFLGGIVPGNRSELKKMVDAGVRGFKAFLIDSGVPEFPSVSYTDVKAAFLELAESPTMVMFHAEKLPAVIPPGRIPHFPRFLYPNSDRFPLHIYENFLASRPPIFEDEAIKMLIDLSKFGPQLPIHVAHVSTAEALPILREAQTNGVNISAETCFHYLSFCSEDIPPSNTRYKSEPPIRNKRNQEELWAALRRLADGDYDHDPSAYMQNRDQEKIEHTRTRPPKKDLRLGPITTIISDHSPCAPAAKLLPSYIPPHSQPSDDQYHDAAIASDAGDFFQAWGGIASVGLGLPILWTDFWKRGWNVAKPSDAPTLIDIDSEKPHSHFRTEDEEREAKEAALIDVVHWCCRNTAELVGLADKKGRLKVGWDGDICVFDPDADWTLEGKDLLFKHKMTAYEGRRFRGRVIASYLRGTKVWSLEEGFLEDRPSGILLLEKRRPEGPDVVPELEVGISGGLQWVWERLRWPFSDCVGE